MWIELLSGERRLPAKQLGKLGDPRALAPLRANALNQGNLAAAMALAELGDDSAIRFLRSDPLENMDPNDESTWRNTKTLAVLLPGEELADRLRHEHPAVRMQVVSTASREGRVDVLAKALGDTDARIRRRVVSALGNWRRASDVSSDERVARIEALKRALRDTERDIRRTAAGGLARLGDSSGEAILRDGLTALDYETRVGARAGIRTLARLQATTEAR